jgi:hypothetical protein
MEKKIKELEEQCAKLAASPGAAPKRKQKGIAKFFNKKEKDAKDKDEDKEDKDQEESDVQNEVLSSLCRTASETKVLKKSFPKSTKAKAIDDWIKLQDLSSSVKTKLEKQASTVFTQFMAQAVADRIGVKECLVDWGATIDGLHKAENKQMIRIAAVAKQLAA